MKTILFFDDWRIQNRDNMVRRLGKPKWIPEAVLEDNLTEGTYNFPTVWYDRTTDRWRAVYCGAVSYGSSRGTRQEIKPRTQVLLYAESPDGVYWEKPDLTGETVSLGRLRTNQVFWGDDSIHLQTKKGRKVDGDPVYNGGPVYYDEKDPNPKHRLKYLYSYVRENGETEQRLATSPDGVHWTTKDIVWGKAYKLDTPIGLFYNRHRDTYVITRRLFVGDRRVAFVETKDFKTFSQPELIIHPDSEDPPLVQFYGMLVFPYDDMYIGLLWRLHTNPTELRPIKTFGRVDCSLTYSYNGWVFNRAFHRAFISPNERGQHGGGCIYTSSMVCCDNGIRFYSAGSKAEHFRNQELNDAALMLHTLRKDGFVYLESYATRGRIITKGIVFKKSNLRLNVSAPYGSVRVQVLDQKAKPIKGFTFHDVIPFTGDKIEYEPRWKSNRSLENLLERPVYLEIEITEGAIYAIRGEFEFVGCYLIHHD